MAMYDATDANHVLAANLGVSTYPAVSATLIRLGTNSGTATVTMTQLASGGGYTTGGNSISWNAPSGQSTSNSATVTWSNSSGVSWLITGLEIWDTAPQRHFFGTWSGTVPITITTGNIFQVNAGNVTAALV